MTVVVTHITPADSSFSTEGAAAWNANHALSGVGTMAEQNANSVAITGGAIDGTTIGATTPAAATFTTLTATGQTDLGTGSAQFIRAAGGASAPTLSAQGSGTNVALNFASKGTGSLNLSSGNGTGLEIADNGSTTGWFRFFGGATTTILENTGAQTNITAQYRTKGTGAHQFNTNGSFTTTQFQVSHTASAVNYVQVTGGSTGNYPSIVGTGSDASVGLQLAGKGGTIDFRNNGVGTAVQFSVAFTASSVNYLSATGSGVSGNAPRLYAVGSDTNISMAFQSKGTGAIDLAAGSSGVNISNGGTVTAITRTAAGTGYTSVPSVAVTAPTTAGGVQATATATLELAAVTPTVVNGGTGYSVNDVLVISGGAFTTAAQVVVSAVSGGVITAVTRGAIGVGYTSVPTNPVSVTGGTGTGATFNVSWGVTSAFTITNAGSGYVEQPTVTFSGGGGSGAAAYATVGSGTTVRSLGSTMDFYSPAGRSFQIQNSPNANPVNFVAVSPNSSGQPPYLAVNGTDTNIAFYLFSKGTGGVESWTGGGRQLLVANTASAVNYVQVTGAATGASSVISTQGSDTNTGLRVSTKGTANISFWSGNQAYTQFIISGANNAVNYLQVAGTTATNAPILSAQGSDTNIDLALTPKGTGLVRFGTYTANMALTVQGYIEIKDSGGTLRKLAVIS